MNRNLKEAYDILRRETPLSDNCGKLCGAHCCNGDDDTGMELFPGEEELFADNADFTVKTAEDGRKILVCRGHCNRNERPLSCRIYPLFPLVYEEDGQTRLQIIYDPRSKSCPLTGQRVKLRTNFYSAVRLSAKYLMRDEDTLDYLKEIGSFLLRLIELEQKLNG